MSKQSELQKQTNLRDPKASLPFSPRHNTLAVNKPLRKTAYMDSPRSNENKGSRDKLSEKNDHFIAEDQKVNFDLTYLKPLKIKANEDLTSVKPRAKAIKGGRLVKLPFVERNKELARVGANSLYPGQSRLYNHITYDRHELEFGKMISKDEGIDS